MVLSEPVSEALLPVYNQLSTLKRCLLEVKDSGGVNSVRELYPYSMKVCSFLFFGGGGLESVKHAFADLEQLNSLDNMRSDGKFIINGEIPEGQAAVADLLAECFDLAYDLRVEIESRSESSGAVEASTEA